MTAPSSDDLSPPKMIATQKEMADAKLPLYARDFCAHLLIPLDRCRREHNFAPWKCTDERHKYEECQYHEYVRRMKILEKQKREANHQ